MEIVRTVIHYSNHFLVPILFALYFYRGEWKKVTLVLWLTMLVDLDHLLATPVFEAHRCSVGFHLLHSYYIIPLYIVLCFFRSTRFVGLGLVLHMLTDSLDCYLLHNL